MKNVILKGGLSVKFGFFAVATWLFQMRQTGEKPVSLLRGQAGNVCLFSSKNLRRYLVVAAAMALAVGWAESRETETERRVLRLSLQSLPASAHQAGTATSGAMWTAKDIRRHPQGHVLAKHMPRWRTGHSMPVLAHTHTCPNWAVITSIFGPTKLTIQLSRAAGWCTVVVGDRKSPAKGEWMQAFESKGGNASSLYYLSPSDQDALPFATARAVPWNHFGRKNVGYLYAIARGAIIIYDTDDDNELLEPDPGGRLSDAAAALMSDTARCDAVCGQPAQSVHNPYPAFAEKAAAAAPDYALPAWPRGFPLDRIHDRATMNATVCPSTCATISILQSLADNDPDVDAIYRMTRALPLNFKAAPRVLSLPPGTMAPFNAQATLYHREAFWGLLLPVTVHGRVADILRSYLVQRLMWGAGQSLAFSSPLVRQVRNAHTYLADFVAEQPLYTKAGELVRHLVELAESRQGLAARMTDLTTGMYRLGMVEAADIRLVQAWVGDLDGFGYEWPERAVKD